MNPNVPTPGATDGAISRPCLLGQEHDRCLRAGEEGLHLLIDVGMAADLFHGAGHHGKRLVVTSLALPKSPDRLFIEGIHGQVESRRPP